MLNVSSYCTTISLLVLGLVACGGGGGGGSSSSAQIDTGTLNLSVTDAPVDNATQVLVQFTGVTGDAIDFSLSGESQTCEDFLDGIDPAPTPGGEASVRCIDLLAFQGNASSSLLREEELNAGGYAWMRLDVDAERGTMDSIIVLDDGSEESLYIPSGSQSGLKLNGLCVW